MLEVDVKAQPKFKSSIYEETLMEKAQIVVDVDLTHLSKSMSLELEKLESKPNEKDDFTIFPVPYKFRQSKKNLFDPSVVSIGPLHHGKESLKATEDKKWRFLWDFLSRGDHISLDLCLSEIKKVEEKTRRCYSESVPFDSNSFVKMMLLDGCFVLEHFLKCYERKLNSNDHSVFIPSDLLLLENQIPFFIVDKLCGIGLKPDTRMDFTNYLANFFSKDSGPLYNEHVSIVKIPPAEIHHLFHLCYHSLIPTNLCQQVVFESLYPSVLSRIKNLLLDFPLWVLTRIFPKINPLFISVSFPKSTLIPCATELQNAGIMLRPEGYPDHMLNISFDHRVLKIPRLKITNENKTLLANLVAFEQYKLHENQEMHANLSSYAMLLDSLVNTPEDVMILQQCGIVNNCLDSDEELTAFLNQICEGMVVKNNHYLAELSKIVNDYCTSRWNKQRAKWNRHKKQFLQDYFSSPWTAISLVAAVFVVLLTFVQTFFAVYAYFVPPS